MPHKKFPRMSQAQLKRLIKSQNQNSERATCILEPPKITYQMLIGPSNYAYSKKQSKTGARPNRERAAKVPMPVLVEHVEPEDEVKQNPSMPETSKQENPNQQDEVIPEERYATQIPQIPQIPQQYSSEVAKEEDGANSPDGGSATLKEDSGSSGYQTGWYWQSGKVLGEPAVSGTSSGSSASFNWPSQGDKSQGTRGPNQSASDPFSMENLKKIAQDFFSYPEYQPSPDSVDVPETKEAEPSDADGMMRSNPEIPMAEAFMTIIKNLRDPYPVNIHLESPSHSSHKPYDGYQSQPGYGNGNPNSRFSAQSTANNRSANSRPYTDRPYTDRPYTDRPYTGRPNPPPGFKPKPGQSQQTQTPNYNYSPDYETYMRQTQQLWPVYLPQYVSQFMFGGPEDSSASGCRRSSQPNHSHII